MRIHKNKQTKKLKTIIISTVLVVFIASVSVYAWNSPSVPFFGNTDDQKTENVIDYKKPTSEQQDAGDKSKESFIKDKYGDAAGPGDDGEGLVSINFTSVKQDQSGLQIRITLDTRSGAGVCSLSLEKDGESPVTREAQVQSMGGYAVCKGFDFSADEMAKGEWTASVKYITDGSVSGSVSTKVSIK